MHRNLAPVAFDDLAKHSPWPKRLFGLEPFDVRHKSEPEVLREFQTERWGALLEHARRLNQPTLAEIQHISTGPNADVPRYIDGAFYLANQQQMLEIQLDLYADVLRPHIEGASCLVELGAGFGSKLLGLSLRGPFANLPLAAGEYTESGCALISLIARQMNKKVAVGRCDFRTLTTSGFDIPQGAVIFTSYAAVYVPEMPTGFVDFLRQFKPKAVIHFEPCYEYLGEQSLHGLMCRRYMALNDYTRNFATILEDRQRSGDIAIQVRKNVLGGNPFLPLSIIEWAPTPAR